MMHVRSRTAGPFWVVSLLALSSSVAAQCAGDWLPGPALAGLGGTPRASVRWDPDGAGPLREHVVFGGNFRIAGGSPARSVAMVDPVTWEWTALATDFDGTIYSLAVVGGELVAGGSFRSIDNVPATYVAKFDGSTWSELGGGVDSNVYDMATTSSGELYVGGRFQRAGGILVRNVACWDGSSWRSVGGGVNSQVDALAVLPNDDLVVYGGITSAGNNNVPVTRTARWDGAAWSALGSGPHQSGDMELFVSSTGELYTLGGIQAVHRWTGSSWVQMPPLAGQAEAMVELGNGDLLVGGNFLPGGPGATYLARWDGVTWHTEFGPTDTVYTMAALPGDRVLLGGAFRELDGRPASHVGLWTATGSYPIASGTDGNVVALRTLSTGDLVGGGGFRVIDGVQAAGLARFDGVRWHPFGSGANGAVRDFLELANGDLVAAGEFTTIDGVAANRIARFDGVRWHPLGAGLDDAAWAMVLTTAGEIVVAGEFVSAGGVVCNRVARWDGAAWHAMAGGMDDDVLALVTTPAGEVVAGGRFTSASGNPAVRVARWDGSAWQAMGTGLGHPLLVYLRSVFALKWHDGRLIAGGDFRFPPNYTDGRVAEWNGQSWAPLAGGLVGSRTMVTAFGELPDGDLLIGGYMQAVTGLPAESLVRWDGTNWYDVGGDLDNLPWAIAMHGPNTLVVGGAVRRANGIVSAGYARYRTSCPASVTEQLTPCVGPAGPLTLAASAGPWIGTTIELAATGFAAQSFGAALIGLTAPGTPLGLLHPTGLPNCRLLASSESVSFVVPSAGAAAVPFTVPNDPVFGGITLHAQFLQAGLVGGAVQTLSGSNGLELALGVF